MPRVSPEASGFSLRCDGEMKNGPIPDLSQRTRRQGGHGGDGSSPEGSGAPLLARGWRLEVRGWTERAGAADGPSKQRSYGRTGKDAGRVLALQRRRRAAALQRGNPQVLEARGWRLDPFDSKTRSRLR